MRKMLLWGGALVAAGFLALSIPSAAGAATGYPPTTGSGSATVTLGSSTTATACGFTPGSTVSISVNGASYGSATAGSTGCVSLTIGTQSANGVIQLNVDGGSFVTGRCGANSVVLTGSQTFTLTVNIVGGACTAAVVTPAPPAAAPPSGLAFTGADIAMTTIGGLLLIGAGSVLLVALRRRHAGS